MKIQNVFRVYITTVCMPIFVEIAYIISYEVIGNDIFRFNFRFKSLSSHFVRSNHPQEDNPS